jgi:RNA polymerase sigma-70 factor, ECF subfamily
MAPYRLAEVDDMSVTGSIDATALDELEPYRRELTAYCYRMLASPQDAEDAVQDALVRAWRGLAGFENRAGLRPWLYRIATNVCLDTLKARGRRALPMDFAPASGGQFSFGPPRPATSWVQPIPDRLVAPADGDPAEVAVSRESIRLAFIAALQHLLPRQRAVLILRDVLRWKANEVADLLDTTVDAVNSTLRRARSALQDADLDAVPTELAEGDRDVLVRYIDAFERYDVDALVALLHEDVTLAMPPFDLWMQGHADVRRFLLTMADDAGHDHVIPTAANGSPALAVYRRTVPSGPLEPHVLQVLDIVDGRIVNIHAFLDPALFSVFGLPASPETTTSDRSGR